MSLPPRIAQSIVPQSTIVPQDDSLFIPYFTRTYESLAQAINAKDNGYFSTTISSTATNIPNMANFGAFIIVISGAASSLPCLTAALSKADINAAGVVTPLNSQAGTTSPWTGATLTITSTATNFQIAHSVSGQVGSFNIRIIGTQ